MRQKTRDDEIKGNTGNKTDDNESRWKRWTQQENNVEGRDKGEIKEC